jgi:hypothetical protein
MASATMHLGDLLNMLSVGSVTSTRRTSIKDTTAQPPTAEGKRSQRKNIYLSPRGVEILTKIAMHECHSESQVMNDALLFYDRRGQYLESLIKTSIQEALQEFRPVVSRRRVLVRREVPCTR